jgi:ABC-type polysaccharide/polyol phosphate export permease
MDLRTRYRRSVLGLGWSLVHPIAMTVILCTMFANILKVDVWKFGPHVLSGLACWSYILTSTIQGCQSIFMGEAYIRQYPTPLAIYPLRTTLSSTIHFLIALSVVLVFSWFVYGFKNLAVLWALVPGLVLLFGLCYSLGIIAGLVNVMFQDTQHLCEVGFQALFYLTPIMYYESMLRNHALSALLTMNPLLAFLRLVRQPILEATVPDLATYVVAGLTVSIVATIACTLLSRMQKSIIFYL